MQKASSSLATAPEILDADDGALREEVFLCMFVSSPATAPKILDARVVTTVGKPQEEGIMMSTAASLSLNMKPRLNRPIGES